MRGAEAHGIVFPLITTSSGVKFGKTESGTVWLDSSLTLAYRFYQFWYNTDDRDVIQYLKLFTLLGHERIDEFQHVVETAPEKREAQAMLAQEVTRRVHGETAIAQAMKASKIFFGGEITDVDEKELMDIFSDVPSIDFPKVDLGGEGFSLVQLVEKTGAAKSRGDARRAIESGGIYLNNKRIVDVKKQVTIKDANRGKFIVLRKGGKNYFLVKIV